jgi:hypothetical protein
LYRGVKLVKKDPVHVAQWGVFAPSTVQQPFSYTAAAHATVTPSTELINAGAENAFVLSRFWIKTDQFTKTGSGQT